MQALTEGFAAYREAWSLMNKARLWRWALFPGLLSLLLGGALLAWGWTQTGAFGQWLAEKYPFETGKALVQTGAALLAGIFMLAVVFFLFRYLVMVVVGPFMSLLSEKAETFLDRQPAPSASMTQLISDLIRGVRIALRNIGYELLLTISVLLLGLFIPLLGQALSAVLIFLIQAYYAGFGNLDYTLERKQYTVRQSVAFVRQRRMLAIANGTGFLLLLFIPFFGLFLAPALGTVAGVLVLRRKTTDPNG